MQTGDRAYLTVVKWPDAMMHPQRVETLVKSCGIDPFHADAAVARGTPGIVAIIDARVAGEVVRPLLKAGAIAIAPGQEAIAAASQRIAAKALERMDQGETFLVHAWRGSGRVLRAGQVVLISRGRVAMTEVRSETDYSRIATRHATRVLGAMHGVPVLGPLDGDVTVTRNTKYAEVMDLYDREGAPVRIDGRKFNFDVLGKKGFSDRENLDKLMVMLMASRPGDAPPCEVDLDFGKWHAPAHLAGSQFAPAAAEGRVRKNDQTASFDFYTAWRYLVWCATARVEGRA